jgi:hypothetical protein
LDYARKKDAYKSEPVGEQWILRNRILAAGQHRGSTSATRSALNALVAN